MMQSRPTTTWLVLSSLISVLMCAAVSPAFAAPPSMQYQCTTVNGVWLQIITADLNDPSLLVTPLISPGATGQRKSFSEFVKENHSLAQITGTFFDLKSGEAVGDIVIRGQQRIWSVGIGSALVVTPDNVASIVDSPGTDNDWVGYESVLQGGLRLVRHGQPAVDPEGQGFHDRYMQRKTSRVAVGILPGNRLILVESGHALLPDLAVIMVQLGCTDAMALDGGGSTSIAYDGKCILASSRKLANVLAIVQRSPGETAARIADAQRKQASREESRAFFFTGTGVAGCPLWLQYLLRIGALALAFLGILALTILLIRRSSGGYRYPNEFFPRSPKSIPDTPLTRLRKDARMSDS